MLPIVATVAVSIPSPPLPSPPSSLSYLHTLAHSQIDQHLGLVLTNHWHTHLIDKSLFPVWNFCLSWIQATQVSFFAGLECFPGTALQVWGHCPGKEPPAPRPLMLFPVFHLVLSASIHGSHSLLTQCTQHSINVSRRKNISKLVFKKKML